MVANVQFINASLAIQLANAWICQHKNGLYFLITVFEDLRLLQLRNGRITREGTLPHKGTTSE
jgi:hypothetical protein